MIIAQELYSPFFTNENLPIYGRVTLSYPEELNNFLALKIDATPIIFKNSDGQFLRQCTDELIEEHLACARLLLQAGQKSIVIAADNDGALQKRLSPRFNTHDITTRAEPLLQLYSALKALVPQVSILLTVEELAPGGLDATDGIFIAKKLEEIGLHHIIATSGTKDFMPLYDRRMTQKKYQENDEFDSREPSLAAALWLQKNTGLSVSCLSFIDNIDDAKKSAQALGFFSLIKKAQNKN